RVRPGEDHAFARHAFMDGAVHALVGSDAVLGRGVGQLEDLVGGVGDGRPEAPGLRERQARALEHVHGGDGATERIDRLVGIANDDEWDLEALRYTDQYWR